MSLIIHDPNEGLGYKLLTGKFPDKPKVLPLRIDALSLTLDIPEQEQSLLYKKLEAMKSAHHQYAYYAPPENYQNGYQIVLPNIHDEEERATFHIHIRPKTEGNYMRVKWNPSKLSSTFIREYMDLLLPKGFNRLMTQGKPTTYHEALDVCFCRLGEWGWRFPKIQVSSLEKIHSSEEFKSGDLETIYLGSRKSPRCFCIYNKRQHLKKKGSKFTDKHGVTKPEPDLEHEMVRVECRYKLGPKNLTLKQVKELPDAFQQLEVLHSLPENVSGLKPLPMMIWKQFTHNYRYIGFQQAWLLLTKEYQNKFKPILKKYTATWWDPDSKPERVKAIDRVKHPPKTPTEYQKEFKTMGKVIAQTLKNP